KSIVLIGPVWNEQDEAKAALDKEENVYFLGYKKYSDAPMYIQQFDLGIIPHKTAGFSATTNPMKMYEYLACQKPVVATDNIGTENVNEIISVAKDYKDFNQKVNEELSSDSEEKRNQRKEFIRKYSWFNTVNKMLELINNKLS
ncbi:glycosyltransferase, partial [bacterium]|nr:glycosyltransferase [bacterium]